jgi:hypothetical protein
MIDMMKFIFGLHKANSMLIMYINISDIQTGRNVSLVRTYQIVIFKECTFSAFLSVNLSTL